MNKKVLITGSEGLIGKKLVEHYKSLKYDVINYDLLDDSNGEHWHWNTVKKMKFDIIHHCASKCVIRDVIKYPEQALDNIMITNDIMELARKYPPEQLFLYSSNRVTANIENPYVTSKKYMEQLAKGYKNCYDLDSIIIRPETIWGYKKGDIRAMPAWIENTINNKSMDIYGPIDKELSPLYVDNFIDTIKDISNKYDDMKNKVWTITGEKMYASEIAFNIQKYFNTWESIYWHEAEMTQPQKIVQRKNEFRIPSNLENEITKYLEEKNKDE